MWRMGRRQKNGGFTAKTFTSAKIIPSALQANNYASLGTGMVIHHCDKFVEAHTTVKHGNFACFRNRGFSCNTTDFDILNVNSKKPSLSEFKMADDI